MGNASWGINGTTLSQYETGKKDVSWNLDIRNIWHEKYFILILGYPPAAFYTHVIKKHFAIVRSVRLREQWYGHG